jgi:hypothetical protein
VIARLKSAHLRGVTHHRKHSRMKRTTYLILCLSSALPGCSTTEGEFPSLARRPFEGEASIEAPVVVPLPLAKNLPDTVAAQIRGLTSRQEQAAAAYNKLLPSVRSLARSAAGSAIGSEAWVNAHLQVSRLDKSRSDGVAAMALMDDLVAKRTDAESAGEFPLYVPLLKPAQAAMARIVAQQTEEIASLSLLIGQ